MDNNQDYQQQPEQPQNPQPEQQPVQPQYQQPEQPQYQQPYQQPQKQPQPETFLNNPIVTLILSIISFFLCWPLALVSLVLAIIALVKKNSGDIPQAQNLAKIGTIVSIVSIILGIIILLIWGAAMFSGNFGKF